MARDKRTSTSTLSSFEGSDVKATAIEIPNASGGLNEAMAVEPVELHHEETVYVVLECKVQKIRHDPIMEKNEPTGDLTRVHILKAGRSTIVDAALVKKAIDEQHARIIEAREALGGQDPIPGTEVGGPGLHSVGDGDE